VQTSHIVAGKVGPILGSTIFVPTVCIPAEHVGTMISVEAIYDMDNIILILGNQ
jgi:hypothetical protein